MTNPTPEQLEAAAIAIHEVHDRLPWHALSGGAQSMYRQEAVAALNASGCLRGDGVTAEGLTRITLAFERLRLDVDDVADDLTGAAGAVSGTGADQDAWAELLDGWANRLYKSLNPDITESLETVAHLRRRAERAEQMVERVRGLHSPWVSPAWPEPGICAHCRDRFPCATVRALEEPS